MEPYLDEFQSSSITKTSLESTRTLQKFFGLLSFLIKCQDTPSTNIYNASIKLKYRIAVRRNMFLWRLQK